MKKGEYKTLRHLNHSKVKLRSTKKKHTLFVFYNEYVITMYLLKKRITRSGSIASLFVFSFSSKLISVSIRSFYN